MLSGLVGFTAWPALATASPARLLRYHSPATATPPTIKTVFGFQVFTLPAPLACGTGTRPATGRRPGLPLFGWSCVCPLYALGNQIIRVWLQSVFMLDDRFNNAQAAAVVVR